MVINNFKGEYGFLSNFYHAEVVSPDGRVWPTSEHAFQASKTKSKEWQKRIQEARSPGLAKRLGRSHDLPLVADWDDRKDSVMEAVVLAKFTQHEGLAQLLLDTRPHELVEGNTWGDRYWGQVEGRGQNKLGKILMHLRDEVFPKMGWCGNQGNVWRDIRGEKDYS